MTRQLTHTAVSPPRRRHSHRTSPSQSLSSAGATTSDSTATYGTETIHQHADIDVCIVAHLFCCTHPPGAGTATGDSTVTYGARMIHTKTRHIDVCIQANYGHHKYCNIPPAPAQPPPATCTHPSHGTVPSIAQPPETMAATHWQQCSQHYHLHIHTHPHRHCAIDAGYLPYMTTPDVTFLNHTLRLMRPLLITRSIFLIYCYIFLLHDLCSYFHAMKIT